MDVGVVTKPSLCITHLYDEALSLIFKKLDKKVDRNSFGLTCHHFLDIQNSNLKCLNLGSHYKIDSAVLDRLLSRFRNLYSLSLHSSYAISDSGLSKLQIYGSNIQCLSLFSCEQLTDVALTFVASGCPLLSVICLSRCSITDTGIDVLTKACQFLIEVNIALCEEISDLGVQSMLKNCRQIRALSIKGCSKILGVGFQGCSPTLAYLEAGHCVLDSTGVTQLFSGGGLEYLNLSFHRKDNIGLGFAANLKILDFTSCGFVKDEAIISISKGCPMLKEWSLNGCDKIGISGWEAIGMHCHNLAIIQVNRCDNLCDQGLLALGNGCKSLGVIYMTQCVKVTPSGINVFKMHRKDVKIKEMEVRVTFPFWRFTWPFTLYLNRRYC